MARFSLARKVRPNFWGDILFSIWVYAFGFVASLGALYAAYLRLVSRTEELRKSRVGLTPAEVRGEVLQDRAAWAGFGATLVAFVGVAFLPAGEAPAWVPVTAGWILAILWLLALIHVITLWHKHSPIARSAPNQTTSARP